MTWCDLPEQVCKASVEAVENKTPYHPWKKILAKILGVEISNKVPD